MLGCCGLDREQVTIHAPAAYTSSNVISLAATVSTSSATPGTSTWDIARWLNSGGNTIAA